MRVVHYTQGIIGWVAVHFCNFNGTGQLFTFRQDRVDDSQRLWRIVQIAVAIHAAVRTFIIKAEIGAEVAMYFRHDFIRGISHRGCWKRSRHLIYRIGIGLLFLRNCFPSIGIRCLCLFQGLHIKPAVMPGRVPCIAAAHGVPHHTNFRIVHPIQLGIGKLY